VADFAAESVNYPKHMGIGVWGSHLETLRIARVDCELNKVYLKRGFPADESWGGKMIYGV
jgi:hypothetical protein